MKSEILIGNIDSFAIKIHIDDNSKQTGRIRFVIDDKLFGDFKKTSKLKIPLSALKKIFEYRNNLYDVSFEGKTEQQVFEQALCLKSNIHKLTERDYELMEKYQKFSFNFGSQFDSVSHIIYIRDNNVHFLWSTNSDYSKAKIDYSKNFQSAIVSLLELKKVVLEFDELMSTKLN